MSEIAVISVVEGADNVLVEFTIAFRTGRNLGGTK